MLTALALTLLCADAPAVETAPPSTPPMPEAVQPLPATESSDVASFARFVDRHLLAVDFNIGGFSMLKVRQRERSATLGDDDFSTLFKMVPEAEALAQRAHENFRSSFVFQIVGLGLTLGALVPTLLMGFIPGGLLVLAVTSLALLAGGLVMVLIGGPMAQSAQNDMLSAVAMHNRGLLERRPVPTADGGSLDTAFRDGLAYALPR